MTVNFEEFRQVNVERNEEAYKGSCKDWSANDWATALTGEVGELCNILKKIRRGDFALSEVQQEVADELADVFIYLDLLAVNLGVDLGKALVEKFNRKSVELPSTVYLYIKEWSRLTYVRFAKKGGSTGRVIKLVNSNCAHVQWFYGLDVNGKPMTSMSNHVDLHELESITYEQFKAVALRQGWGEKNEDNL